MRWVEASQGLAQEPACVVGQYAVGVAVDSVSWLQPLLTGGINSGPMDLLAGQKSQVCDGMANLPPEEGDFFSVVQLLFRPIRCYRLHREGTSTETLLQRVC